MFYLTDTDDRPQGWAAAERDVGSLGRVAEGDRLQDGQGEVEPSAGDERRRQRGGAPMGLLSTAGKLLFGNDGGGNFVAYDPATGKPLWHAGLGMNTSNGPETYLLDGRQYVVVGAGDTLYAFTLPR